VNWDVAGLLESDDEYAQACGDLAYLHGQGALAGIAEVIRERRRLAEQQDEAPGKPSLPYAAEAELDFGNYAEAAALLAAEIDPATP
jgi:hypothetical protein